MPQPSLLLQFVSLLVIASWTIVAGGMTAYARQSQQWFFCLPGIACAIWIVWIQTLGTFRPHERRANETGNWLIGVAALLAIGLAALPMTAQPLHRMTASVATAIVVSLFAGGVLNIRWARQLRKQGVAPIAGWKFSIRELLVITTAVAFGLGSYLVLRNEMASRKWFVDV